MTKLVKTVPLGATVGKESQQTNFQLSAWRGIRGDTVLICQGVVEEIVEGKDEIPDQLFGSANIISETSSGINVTIIRICPPIHITHLFFFSSFQSLNNHYKKNFQRLLGEASCLVVVLQQLYNNSHSHGSIWPPLGLKRHIKELIQYMAVPSVRRVSRLIFLFTARCTASMDLWQENARRTLPNESWWVVLAYGILESSRNISGGWILWHLV